MTTLIGSFALILALGAAWYLYWKPHAARFQTSGYMPPATSWMGEFVFNFLTRLLTFVTVGRVKVIGRHNSPGAGRVIYVSNHQYPVDFAMLCRGAGRHLRMLTDSGQLGGFFGVLSAYFGVISVGFGKKSDGAQAEKSCVRAVASKHFRIGSGLAALIWGIAGGIIISSAFGAFSSWLVPAIAAVAAFAVLCMPGSDPGLGIFPQGGLLPDDPELAEHFRPGSVRIGQAASLEASEPVLIVPIGIHYRQDPKRADWTHGIFKKYRSMFLATRNPKYWNPLFKQNIDGLPEAERQAIEKQREEMLAHHKKTRARIYGGVVVVGEPIDVASLPADPIEASAVLKTRVAELLAEARKH